MQRIKEHGKDQAYVLDKVVHYSEEFTKTKTEREQLLDKIGASKRLRVLLYLMDDHTFWQDERKKVNLQADHHIDLLLKEVNRRKKIPFDDLLYTIPFEVIDLLRGEPVDLSIIQKRKEIVGIIYTPDQYLPLNYEDSVRLDKEINSQYSMNGLADLFGTVANLGKVRGKVKILMEPDDFKLMEKGDVLVTSMTRPEFVPILKKAAAIVTDEGGLTCHAAIVARELDVPCIVGTKIATKVLKNGDSVEVNANHGVVRIL
ncbi:hypothetical protein GOV09_01930 [Candidatus Woesearchaeota archaeon]|nr:hypothetical protein [Candidatus Woesearchaeota archaeon]